MTYGIRVCGPSSCPSDPAFEHDNYFGCVPTDFSPRTGLSKTYRQVRGADGIYYWNGGGCVGLGVAALVALRDGSEVPR
jgi:hypothetical protein